MSADIRGSAATEHSPDTPAVWQRSQGPGLLSVSGVSARHSQNRTDTQRTPRGAAAAQHGRSPARGGKDAAPQPRRAGRTPARRGPPGRKGATGPQRIASPTRAGTAFRSWGWAACLRLTIGRAFLLDIGTLFHQRRPKYVGSDTRRNHPDGPGETLSRWL